MYHITMTVGDVFRDILSRRRISEEEFARRFEFSRSSVYRWRLHQVSAKEVSFRLIEALAEVDRTTVADIFLRTGVDVNQRYFNFSYLEPDDSKFVQLNLSPLESNFQDDPKLVACVKAAIKARWMYCYDGCLPHVLLEYERGMRFASEAKAWRLLTYLKVHAASVAQMIGDLDKSEQLIIEARDEANRYIYDGRRRGDELLELLGHRLYAESRIRWLWVHRWARAISNESISDGLEFLRELKDSPFSQQFPSPYTFLARCFAALNEREEAIRYIEVGELREFSLTTHRQRRLDLFLDVEPSLHGNISYSWGEDQMLGAKTDVLIAIGEIEEAFKTYSMIDFHRPPQIASCYHSWFDPKWQMFLRRQNVISLDADPKLNYSIDEYDDELELSGNRRVQALNMYSKGEDDENRGDFLWARFRYERAHILALEGNAVDIAVKSSLASSLVTAKLKKPDLAMKQLEMIQTKVHRINNPVIRQQYFAAQEAIAHQ